MTWFANQQRWLVAESSNHGVSILNLSHKELGHVVSLVSDIDLTIATSRNWRVKIQSVKKDKTALLYVEAGQLMHRVIHGLVRGNPMHVDHINGIGLDNRRENHRFASPSQNAAGKRWISPDKGSKYRGVSWFEENHSWRAIIKVNYKNVYLGCFDDEIEAARAYDAAANHFLGEFSTRNFPSEMPGALKLAPKKVSKTGFKGVFLDKQLNVFRAVVYHKTKEIRVGGTFPSAVEAAKARDELARSLNIPEHKMNFPRQ